MITYRCAPCTPAAAPNVGHSFTQPVKFITQVMVSDKRIFRPSLGQA
jgi:hypothetical protein